VNWYRFNHPQLGEVELGGWNYMYTWRNPPHHYMGEESKRNVPFALALGKMLPHIEIHTLEVRKVGPETFTLNLVLDNDGFFPTYTSNQGKKRESIRSPRIQLEIPDHVKLLNGREKTEIGHLEGRSNKIGAIFTVASPTDNRSRHEWTLQADSGTKISIQIISDRAGTISEEIMLV
jgi:hypothetical protein